jgi:hypothetical protein
MQSRPVLVAYGGIGRGTCVLREAWNVGVSEMSRVFFHCSDGYDLVIDREGIEADESDILWCSIQAAERLMRSLPHYEEWASWVVAVHDERGCLIDTVPFPAHADTDEHEQGWVKWGPSSPPTRMMPSTRLH